MICILIPALNEETQLRALLPLIPDRLLGTEVSVVVISDGSTDGTQRVVTENGADLVHLSTHSGKGAALRAGARRAATLGYDYLVTMDGDGQHDPVDLNRLVAPVAAGLCDATFGSRYLEDRGCGHTPVNRFVVRRAMVWYLRRTLGRTFSDPFCGYRCFNRAAFERIRLSGDGYHSELEAIFDCVIDDLRVLDVPVRRIYGVSTSKMGAGGGAFRGRMRVLRQYLEVVRRKSRELKLLPDGVSRHVGVSGPSL